MTTEERMAVVKDMPERRTYDIEEASQLAGWSRNTGYAMARAGTFPGLLQLAGARRYLVSKSAFDAWLARAEDALVKV